jgi:hypothetical protein
MSTLLQRRPLWEGGYKLLSFEPVSPSQAHRSLVRLPDLWYPRAAAAVRSYVYPEARLATKMVPVTTIACIGGPSHWPVP